MKQQPRILDTSLSSVQSHGQSAGCQPLILSKGQACTRGLHSENSDLFLKYRFSDITSNFRSHKQPLVPAAHMAVAGQCPQSSMDSSHPTGRSPSCWPQPTSSIHVSSSVLAAFALLLKRVLLLLHAKALIESFYTLTLLPRCTVLWNSCTAVSSVCGVQQAMWLHPKASLLCSVDLSLYPQQILQRMTLAARGHGKKHLFCEWYRCLQTWPAGPRARQKADTCSCASTVPSPPICWRKWACGEHHGQT